VCRAAAAVSQCLNRRQRGQPRGFLPAARAFEATADRLQVAPPAARENLDRAHRVGGGAVVALYAQRAAEADEIAGGAHMLGGHASGLARGEHKVNMAAEPPI